MRHHKRATPIFGRVKNQRTALMRSLARSLVLEEGIVTTVAKAKALRPFVERLVTASKRNTLASRRSVAARLGNAQDAVTKLHDTLAVRFATRAGGYTRVVRLGKIGKQATDSARIEFVK
jgi:large subunit ribosomal protein L17